MARMDADLDRLLRAAAAAPQSDEWNQPPFGFETRVVANWRTNQRFGNGGWRAFTRLFRRVVLSAAAVTICASAAAYWQFAENDDLTEPSLNAYAIADSAIDASAWQQQ